MDINSAFPSIYIKAADLQGREITVAVDDVRFETMPDDQEKPVVYFIGKTKGFVLNKTNATAIAEQLGSETDTWHNKPITIYPTQTDFGGRIVACIRVKLNSNPQPQAQPQAQPLEAQLLEAQPPEAKLLEAQPPEAQPPQAQPPQAQQPTDDIPF